jgi:hypothetical protein
LSKADPNEFNNAGNVKGWGTKSAAGENANNGEIQKAHKDNAGKS